MATDDNETPWLPDTSDPDAFVNSMYGRGRELGMNEHQARLMASQAALESNWGRSGLSTNGNNYFGMKAGSSWDGDTVGMPTKEQNPDGSWRTENAGFRKYGSVDESIKDYQERLAQKWPDAHNATDWEGAKSGLKFGQQGGYATDQNYGAKLDKIASRINPSAQAPMDMANSFSVDPGAPQPKPQPPMAQAMSSGDPASLPMAYAAQTKQEDTPNTAQGALGAAMGPPGGGGMNSSIPPGSGTPLPGTGYRSAMSDEQLGQMGVPGIPTPPPSVAQGGPASPAEAPNDAQATGVPPFGLNVPRELPSAMQGPNDAVAAQIPGMPVPPASVRPSAAPAAPVQEGRSGSKPADAPQEQWIQGGPQAGKEGFNSDKFFGGLQQLGAILMMTKHPGAAQMMMQMAKDGDNKFSFKGMAPNGKGILMGDQEGNLKIVPLTAQYQKDKKEDLPSSAQEFNFAKENGYTGSYEDFMTGVRHSSGSSGKGANLDDETTASLARSWNLGDEKVLTRMSEGNKARVLAEAARQRKEAGTNEQSVMQGRADQGGRLVSERKYADLGTKMDTYGATFKGGLEVARQQSKDVARSDFTPFNKGKQFWDSLNSDPKLAGFQTAINTLVNDYAQAINPQGKATVADKQHARELLNTVDSQDAFEARLKVMEQEVQRAHSRLREAHGASQARGRGETPQEDSSTLANPQAAPAKKRFKYDAQGNLTEQ